jgi:glycogen(starch) synthase
MKIAFVFYEYPPDTADGGIATYLRQAARMLCARGHQVEVFAGARGREGTFDDGDGITVHRIACPDGRARFHRPVAAAFQQRHARVGFDVVEGAEYLADSRDIPAWCPEIPLVVRLHTGTYLLNRLNRPHWSSMLELRAPRGAWRQWMRRSYWRYDKARDVERLHALDADHIASPSSAMSNVMISAWDLDPQRVALVPYLCVPSKALLDVPVDTCTNTVTFLGRLEVRKGVLDLARAIPRIFRRHPQVRFRFVGRPHHYSPQPGLDMLQYLQRELARYGEAVEFAGSVALDEVPDVLARTDVCVFPSVWEAWGYSCAEAMAAARGVVGSRAGGMADLLARDSEGKEVGLGISPNHPKDLAKAVSQLLEHSEWRFELGRRARRRIVKEYGANAIGPKMEDCFRRAIEHRRSLGPRTTVLGAPVTAPQRFVL